MEKELACTPESSKAQEGQAESYMWRMMCSENRPGKGRVVENASINQVLENFESVGCERNGAIRVKRSGVTIALDDRNDEAGLPSGRNHSEAKDEVEEGKQKMTPLLQ